MERSHILKAIIETGAIGIIEGVLILQQAK